MKWKKKLLAKKQKSLINPRLLNENIPFSPLLLVKETENQCEKIILTKSEALTQAQAVNLSLLCVDPHASPPVCKLIDYQKHLFQLRKKPTKSTTTNKEIHISFAIGEKDLGDKLAKIHGWLDKNFLVKVNLVRKGQEKAQEELARVKCQNILTSLQLANPQIELQGNIRSHIGSFYFFLSKRKKSPSKISENNNQNNK